MKTRNHLLIVLSFCCSCIQAQVNKFSHLSRHQPCLNANDWHAIEQLNDNGYVFCRSTEDLNNGANGSKLEIIRIDVEGNPVWSKSIYQGIHGTSIAHSTIRKTPTNEILVGTSDFSIADKSKATLTKLDMNGNVKWSKMFPGEGQSSIKSILCDANNNYVACGTTILQDSIACAFIIKTDSAGTLLWQKTIRFSGDTVATYHDKTATLSDCKEVPGEGYLFCGNFINQSAILKYDYNGNMIWDLELGGAKNLNNIALLNNGDIITTGWCEQFPNGYLALVFYKVNAAGNPLTATTITPAAGPYYDSYSWDMLTDNNDNFIFSGYIQNPIPVTIVGKINSSGTIDWVKQYNNQFHSFNYLPSSLIRTSDNGFMLYNSIVGTTTNMVPTYSSSLLKLDINGSAGCDGSNYPLTLSNYGLAWAWQNIFHFPSSNAPVANAISINNINVHDTLICENIQQTVNIAENKFISSVSLYPNPGAGSSTITYKLSDIPKNLSIEIMDLSEKVLYSERIFGYTQGTNKLELNTELNPGMYLYILHADENKIINKMMIQK